MNYEKALNILQISHDVILSEDYLKKRFRHIAKIMHPDKFNNPIEKINAHNKFIELKIAYDFLKDFIDKNSEYLKTTSNNFENKDNPESTYNYKPESMYNWLYLLLMPGALIALPIGLCILSLTIAFRKRKDNLDDSTKTILGVSFFILLTLFILLKANLDFIININQTILIIVIIQCAIWFLIFLLSEIFSFRLKKIIKKEIVIYENK